MRIKAKIAYNHEIGSLPRGAVIEESAKRGQELVDARKFEKTKDEVTHRPPVAAPPVDAGASDPVDQTPRDSEKA